MTALTEDFFLGSNLLTGSIPTEMSLLTNFNHASDFDISSGGNTLTGCVPEGLGALGIAPANSGEFIGMYKMACPQ